MSKYFPKGRHKGRWVKRDRIIFSVVAVVMGSGLGFIVWAVFH